MNVRDREIMKLGLKEKHRGTRYIRDAVDYVANHPYPNTIALTKELYPAVAKQNGTNWKNVEHSMRYALYCAGYTESVASAVYNILARMRE